MTSSKPKKIEACLDVPVEFDEKFLQATIALDPARWWWPWRVKEYPGLCENRGIGRFAKIVVGRAFLAFPPREQQAMLLHEVGHVKLGHVAERARNFWRIVLAPTSFAALCVRQEYQADTFAARCGYGPELAQALRRVRPSESAFHPPQDERITRLLS